MLRAFVCVVASVVGTACAARAPVAQVEPRAPVNAVAKRPLSEPAEASAGKTPIARVPMPPPRSTVQTVEASDPALAAALLRVILVPTAENHRAVADEYMRLGILDTADEYLSDAVKINPRDAAAWDRKARIWRDWGWPRLALPHAVRAVHFAPSSAETRNTLGTVLQALGRHSEARAQYEMALRLDTVLNNICHSLAGDGEVPDGVRACDLAYATGVTLGRREKR